MMRHLGFGAPSGTPKLRRIGGSLGQDSHEGTDHFPPSLAALNQVSPRRGISEATVSLTQQVLVD